MALRYLLMAQVMWLKMGFVQELMEHQEPLVLRVHLEHQVVVVQVELLGHLEHQVVVVQVEQQEHQVLVVHQV